MKYCSKCGAQLEDNALFCSSCGNKLSQEVNEEVKKEEASSTQIDYSKIETASNNYDQTTMINRVDLNQLKDSSGGATAAYVLGIISVVLGGISVVTCLFGIGFFVAFFGIIPSIVGIILGASNKGKEHAHTGLVLSIIGLVLSVLVLIFWFLLIGVAAAGGTTN